MALRTMIVDLFLIGSICGISACGSGSDSQSTVTQSTQPAHPYTTTFPHAENPIAENGVWVNGGMVGLDWTNVQTTTGLVFGTETGSVGFDDSIAILSGSWKPDQTAMAIVHSVNQQSGNIEEVELLLRFQIMPHIARGYEINFRCIQDGTQYSQVVRWNGPFGDFTLLDSRVGPGIRDGDMIKATIIGNVITVYLNELELFSVTDSTWVEGNPGLGFFLSGAAGLNRDYGFTSYTASDGT